MPELRLSDVETRRLKALAVLAPLLLLPSLLSRLPEDPPPPPAPLCTDGAHRDDAGRVVCGEGPPGAVPLDAAELLLAGTPLDLATASAADLELIPGIGPALAARIVADREANGPFASIADVERVRGVGPVLAAKIAAYARVR